MDDDSRMVVDYAVKSSMPAPSRADERERSYDSHQRSRGAVLSLQDNVWEDTVTVFLGNGREVGTYELESEEGPKTLDRINGGGFVEGEDSAEDYTMREVLEKTIGQEASQEVMSQVGVEDAQLNGVYRGMTEEGEEPGRRTSMPMYETQETFTVGEEVDVDELVGDVEFDEYGQIDE